MLKNKIEKKNQLEKKKTQVNQVNMLNLLSESWVWDNIIKSKLKNFLKLNSNKSNVKW
jgi:hypothetical protein